MTREQRKKVFQKMLGDELQRRPELRKTQKVYKMTRLIWVVFSIVYSVISVGLIFYMKNPGLLLASLMIPIAALFCIYFVNTGMRGIVFITLLGGLFELFRGFLMLQIYGIELGRAALAYMICVMVQGAVTLAISVFIIVSPQLGSYISVLKRINTDINLGRY